VLDSTTPDIQYVVSVDSVITKYAFYTSHNLCLQFCNLPGDVTSWQSTTNCYVFHDSTFIYIYITYISEIHHIAPAS